LEQQADHIGGLARGTAAVIAPSRLVATPLTAGSALAQYRRLAWAIGATDVLCVLLAFLLAYDIRFGATRPSLVDFLLVVAIAPAVVVMLFVGFRLYSVQYFGAAEVLRRIVAAVSIAVTVIVMISFWSKASFSRAWIGLSWIFTMTLILVSRRIWHWWMGHARARGMLTFRTLIVGANDEAGRLAQLMSGPTGFQPVGFVATDYRVGEIDGLPVLGDIHELDRLIPDTGAECVFIASSSVSPADISHVTKTVRLRDIDVRISPNLPEMLSGRLTVQPIGGFMALHLKPARLTGMQAAAKRTFDLVFASIALVVALPLWGVFAVLVKATSRGPVLYRQKRVGRGGRPFTLLKFRTMVVGAEAMRDGLTERNEAAGPLFKIRSDPRVTRVGRLLRRFSLDELPQLVNVLRGDMSLVGPRPPLPDEVTAYADWHFDRLQVQPGVTGLWQISGRSDLSFDEYVRLDLFYIENWSLAYDFFILAKTIPILFTREGAY
jgi:exopolysaccharide biosynthesis polyprenyl glycosylphosphotransferase